MRKGQLNWIKRIFCRHDYEIKRWHWTHGPYNNEPAFIEVETVCKKCGKGSYMWCERGSKVEKYIVENHSDLQR